MSPQTLALIVMCYGFLGGVIFASLFEHFRKGGWRDLKNELEAEVEFNVGLLKQIDGFTPKVAVSFPAQEDASVGPDTAIRAGVVFSSDDERS